MHAVPRRHRKSGQTDDRTALGRTVVARADTGHDRRLDLWARPGRDEPGQAGPEAFPRGSGVSIRTSLSVIPAQAGIYPSAVRAVEKWVPAFAGMTFPAGISQ